MTKYNLLALCLIVSGLAACNNGNDGATNREQDALLNSQRAPLDKAHEVEQIMQDRQKQLDQRIQDQTQ